VFKLPSIGDKATKKSPGPKRAGSVVDEYIKDARSEINAEKKKLRSEEM
tara:strand:- start:926 stop:1072 length:147 start_codon:yes stop_codon:yes gene_type:complete